MFLPLFSINIITKFLKIIKKFFFGLDEIIKKEEFLYYVWKEKFLNKTLKGLILFYITEDDKLC